LQEGVSGEAGSLAGHLGKILIKNEKEKLKK